jgi:membrane protein DedA with SNARE-associated domain
VYDFSGLIEHFPYLGLLVLLILGGIGLPFPEGATLILCGFLISTRVIYLLPALLIVYPGILTGDFLYYLFGKKYGRMVVTRAWFKKIISPKRLSLFENKFKKWGPWLILIGGRLFGEIFLAAGILKMRASRLMIIDAISSLFAVFFWIGIGYAGGKSLQIVQKDITRIEHWVVLISIFLIVIWLFERHFWPREGRR